MGVHGSTRLFPLLLLLAGSLPARATELAVAGDVIDHANVARYAHLLSEGAVRWIRDGGWLGPRGRVTLRVGATRPTPLPPSYREATRRWSTGIRLTEAGPLEGWVAGMPFPDPQPPRLAEKILWNQYYRWRGDEIVIDGYRTTQTDRRGRRRETRGVFQLLTLSGRSAPDAPPELGRNLRALRTASKLIFTHPPTSRWQTTLFYRYADPRRDDDVYLYLPSTRRVLRVQGGRRCAPVRGSDFTPDDFFGFDGRVYEHVWRLVGEAEVLALVHQERLPPRLDAYGIWPVGESFEVREVWIVEETPKDAGYCYGRRRLWIDRETFHVLYADVWDRSGVYWKGFLSTYAHRAIESGEAAPVWGGTGAYDFQSGHSTFVTIGPPELGGGYRIDGHTLGVTDFTPGALLRRGR